MQRAVFARFIALAATALLASCGGKRHEAATAADIDKRHAAEYLQSFLIDRDWQRWPDYFAADAKLNGSDLALQIMRGTTEELNFSFSGLTLSIREQIAEPNRVATAFVLQGLFERAFNGESPTHQRIEIEGYAFDRFDSGKVVESRLFIDVWGSSRRAALATQPK